AELAETLQQRPVILTNALVNEIDEHQEIAAEIALLARKSGAPLHSFNLTADFNENARRVVTPDRALDMKLTDAGKLAEMFRDFTVITPPGTRVIDTTAHSALQTARIIRDYLPELAP
ncbi:MAG: hypothetical protein KKA05_06100, partial [Alphaproteobacteria bacterium]|nr:hypothetical protein [Alphaproteobacteria bacterium]